MRKVILILVMSSLLAGCNGGLSSLTDQVFAKNAQPAAIINTLYESAFENDEETVDRLLMHVDGYEGESYEAVEELSAHVMELGGVNNLNITEIKRNQIQSEVAEDLEYDYGDNWRVVSSELGGGYSFVWILQKVDSELVIVYLEEVYLEDIIQ
ncbi:hypothetical protein [Jeotgalibacillus haloalkalitolerans]|uniref:DUF3887 domain-containing protein n=1 Tax=Jeotgalibacillus haloalkalitolerans TaxID=3104292 RepID=A0ABU5KKY4_9BACL|nr:hypothetical protein [Jeotgalibacillus sp. HH7-29]MDZ5711406.1 hypothetical protein [Jeotgalibacillus sp. HH7-29]